MTLQIKHATQVDPGAWPDDPSYPVGTTEWNALLNAVMATGFLLGRSTAGEGPVEELTPAQVRGLLALGTAALANTGVASGNVPILDSNGKLLTSVLPALAIGDTFIVATQAAMLALTAERGDVAIRTDLSKTFRLVAEPATTLANWAELLTPTDVVQSVAGLTGTITAANLRTALALVVGTNVQAQNANLAALAGLTFAQGDLLYATGPNILTKLVKGTAAQQLRINAGATAPEWFTPAAGGGLGIGQTWQDVTRTSGTSYQNLTGKPIAVAMRGQNNSNIEVSTDNATWIIVNEAFGAVWAVAIIPVGHYYRSTWAGSLLAFRELR